MPKYPLENVPWTSGVEFCGNWEGPRCRLVDCSRIVWTRGPRPGLDNGGLVIGRRYLGGMAEMEELISEPCDSPLQIVFDGNSLALTQTTTVILFTLL